jgi:hypothetical protein
VVAIELAFNKRLTSDSMKLNDNDEYINQINDLIMRSGIDIFDGHFDDKGLIDAGSSLGESQEAIISRALALRFRSPFTKDHVCFEELLFYKILSKNKGFDHFLPVKSKWRSYVNRKSDFIDWDHIHAYFSDRNFLGKFSNLGLAFYYLHCPNKIAEATEKIFLALNIRAAVNFMPKAVFFLKEQVRYHDIAILLEIYVDWFNKVASKTKIYNAIIFYSNLHFCAQNLNGRNFKLIYGYKKRINGRNFLAARMREVLIQLMSGLCEYDAIEHLLPQMIASMGHRELLTLRANLISGPIKHRSEKAPERRQALINSVELQLHRVLRDEGPLFPKKQIFDVLKAFMIGDQDLVSSELIKFNAYFSNLSVYEKLYLKIIDIISLKSINRGSVFSGLVPVLNFLIGTVYEDISYKCFIGIRPYLSAADRRKLYFIEFKNYSYHEMSRLIVDNPDLAKERSVIEILVKKALEGGNFDAAEKWCEHGLRASRTPAQVLLFQRDLDRVVFRKRASEISLWHQQPSVPKGIVYLASLTCLNTLALIAPVLQELRRQGYAVIHLSAGMIENVSTGVAEVDQFAGILPPSRAYQLGSKLSYNWKVSWQNREVICEGINFYQGIYERLSMSQRRFHIE